MLQNNSNIAQHAVDQMLPAKESVVLALQHMLTAYASMVVTPLVLAGALGWSTADLTFMLSACLISSGLCTMIQCIGFGKDRIGIRLPVVQGTTIAAIPALIMIGGTDGMTAMFGATIAAGAFTFFIAPWWSRMLRFFPPVVTGTVICVIGLSLFPVAVMWIGNGSGFGPQSVAMTDIALAMFTLALILVLMKFNCGFLSRIAILVGLVLGTVLAMLIGDVSFTSVGEAEWFNVITPFALGAPQFKLAAILAMILAMLVTMVESTGDYIAVGEVCGKKVEQKEICAGLRAEGLGTVLGGCMNSFPYTTYAQNIGVLLVSGVRSRWVVALCGLFLIIIGLVPKLSAVAASIPLPVLGGAGLVLFGSIACTGMKIIGRADLNDNRNLVIVAVSVGMAMLVISNPTFFGGFSENVQIVLNSAITLGGVSALLLNLIFNVWLKGDDKDEISTAVEQPLSH